MRRVILHSKESAQRPAQPAIQISSLPLVPLNQEGSLVQLAKLAPERLEVELTPVLVTHLELHLLLLNLRLHLRALQCPN